MAACGCSGDGQVTGRPLPVRRGQVRLALREGTPRSGVRAIRELGIALRSGPFRIALVLSLILHLLLLAAIGWRWSGHDGAMHRRIPLMRVRILPPAPAPEPAPATVPAAPAGEPARPG